LTTRAPSWAAAGATDVRTGAGGPLKAERADQGTSSMMGARRAPLSTTKGGRGPFRARCTHARPSPSFAGRDGGHGSTGNVQTLPVAGGRASFGARSWCSAHRGSFECCVANIGLGNGPRDETATQGQRSRPEGRAAGTAPTAAPSVATSIEPKPFKVFVFPCPESAGAKGLAVRPAPTKRGKAPRPHRPGGPSPYFPLLRPERLRSATV